MNVNVTPYYPLSVAGIAPPQLLSGFIFPTDAL